MLFTTFVIFVSIIYTFGVYRIAYKHRLASRYNI